MLKPVKVIPPETNQDFSARTAVDLSGTMSFILLGHPVQLTTFEIYSMPVDTYIQMYKRKSVLLKVQLEGDASRFVYVFFEFNTSITLGCLMRQLQESLIKEKIDQQDFSGPIRDAFGEIANQFTGSLDRILRNNTHANAHLVLDFRNHIFPDESIEEFKFVKNEEYIVWISTFTAQGYPKSKITILFPQSFYEAMMGQRVKLEGIKQKKIFIHSKEKSFVEGIAKKVNSRFFEVVYVDQYSDMVHLCKDTDCCLICIDFERMPTPIPHDVKIFAKRMLNARVPESIPIWISLPNAKPEAVVELELAGLRASNSVYKSSEMENWVEEQLSKIPLPR